MRKNRLKDLRKEIDRIDSRVIELLNRRGKISFDIGEIKKAKKQPIYSPDRESLIYRKISKKNKGPFTDESVTAIYREIMSACLSLEHSLVVAYLGPELTFTHQVSIKKFGASVTYLSCDNISDVFREVEKGNADYGVVPIENSIEGAVSHTMDMFANSPLMICSEACLRIRHSLLSKNDDARSIARVYSNPQVFAQCRGWLEKNLYWAKLKESTSTAKAAEIAGKHPTSACIASDLAAKRYDLKVVARSIEDSADNVTRFLVIGENMSSPSGDDKTSIMFSVKDRSGVLHDMLTPFKKAGINLTKIESRPSKLKAWKYYFFVDMEGHCMDGKVERALKKVQDKCDFIKILGSYPRAK